MSAHFHPERTADEDAFNRRKFAENLALGIAAPHGDGGLVVAIEGEWGSGKSSILRWVVEDLGGHEKIKRKPIVIQFNPWRISGQDALIETFLTLLAAQIGGESNTSNAEKGAAAGERIMGYLKLLRHLKYLKYVPAVGWAGQIAGDVADYAEKASEAGDAFVDDVRKNLAKDKGIEGLRDSVNEALGELDREVVVVMDDLDRLTRDEIRTTFQLLKAVADFKHITYLLAFDPERVALSLADNGDKEEGRAFLEKIVQVAYPIPPLFPWQAVRFTRESLERTLAETTRELMPFEKDIWPAGITLVAKLARHPREILRLCNRLRLSWPATAGAVNACDVMVYEALSQRLPDLARAIRTWPSEFTGNAFSSEDADFELDWDDDFADREEQTQFWRRHLPKEAGDELLLATLMCHFLFPYTKGEGVGPFKTQWRIADTEILARLLQGTGLDGIPDAQDFHRALANPDELKATLDARDLESQNDWLFRAMQYAPDASLPNPHATIEALAQQCTKSIHEKTADATLCRNYSGLTEIILSNVEITSRPALFSSLIDFAPLSVSANILDIAATECGLVPTEIDRKKTEQHRLIHDEETVTACIERWKTKAQQASDTGILIEEPLLHSILYRWGQLGDKPCYAPAWRAVEKLCESKTGLQCFLDGYPNRDFPSRLPDIMLVRNPEALLTRIHQHPDLKETHSQFVARLSDPTALQELDTLIKSQEQ